MTTPLEVKAIDSSGEFEGYGSVFGNTDLGGDIVAHGAFFDSLERHEAAGTLPQMFWMHQMDQVPGKWLSMAEDDYGLKVRGQLLPTQLGNDVKILMENKAVRGLSIGFTIEEQDYTKGGDRVLKAVDLVETSIVSLAMNPLARVTSQKARLSESGEYVPRPTDFEHFLRDAGYSRRVAKGITSKVFSRREADEGQTDELAETVERFSEFVDLYSVTSKARF